MMNAIEAKEATLKNIQVMNYPTILDVHDAIELAIKECRSSVTVLALHNGDIVKEFMKLGYQVQIGWDNINFRRETVTIKWLS